MRVPCVYGSTSDVYAWQNNYLNNSLSQGDGGGQFHATTGARQTYMRRFTSTVPARGAQPQIVLLLTHVYDTKKYLKKLFDKRFRRIFFSAFQ